MSAFCCREKCGHNRSCHVDFTSEDGSIVIKFCALCGCSGFERQLAINTQTEAERRAEARLIAQKLMEVARG